MKTQKKLFRDGLLEKVREDVQCHLKDHKIKQLHSDGEPGRIWRCKKDGTNVMAFTICAPPGWLIMYGDMGECMWSRLKDMLEFVRSSIDSLGYFSEKVSRDCVIREEREELAHEWVESFSSEWLANSGEALSKDRMEELRTIKDNLKYDSDLDSFKNEVWNSNLVHDGDSMPNLRYYTYSYLWKIEALKWFIANLDAGNFTKVARGGDQ